MSNLIPIKNKSEIKKEYLARLSSIILFFIFFTIIVLIVFSIPSLFLLRNKVSISEEKVVFLDTYIEKRQESDVSSILFSTNEKMMLLNLPETPLLYKSVETVLNRINSSISISSLSFKTTGEKRTLFISGKAGDRDGLIAFTDSLKTVSEFSDVNLPISNLAKSKNINFDLKIEFSPNL